MERNIKSLRVLVVVGLIVGVSACQQERNNTGAAGGVKDVPAATVSALTTSQPAAAPAGDPSLPPYGTLAAPPSGVDAAQTVLTPAERDKAMPLEGQTNTHGSDAFAKRGDEQIPRETAVAPRGDEPLSTPNSSPKESK